MGFNWAFKGLKNTQMQNLIKIRPVGAELFHTDGRTDGRDETVAFHSFGMAPKSWRGSTMFQGFVLCARNSLISSSCRMSVASISAVMMTHDTALVQEPV